MGDWARIHRSHDRYHTPRHLLDYLKISFPRTHQMIQGSGDYHAQALLLLHRVEQMPRLAVVCPI